MKKHIITALLVILGIGLLVHGPNSGRAQTAKSFSKQVIFKTTEKAPTDFNAWAFHWKAPQRDPDAKLECVIMRPDGKVYDKFDISQVKAGAERMSNFSSDYVGHDLSVFYNQNVIFIFRVSKGNLVFDEPEKYFFDFRKVKKVGASMEVK